MTSTCTYSDIVLPAATWYEKHDISTTDMHPFVHSFNPAIAPPWETRTDFDAFATIARGLLPAGRASTWAPAPTSIAAPLMHDTADETGPARRAGAGLEGAASASRCPGVTMPRLVTVERDYAAVAEKMAALGPLVDTLGTGGQGRHLETDRGASSCCAAPTAWCAAGSPTDGPSLARDIHLAEAILALSGTTNGEVAVAGLAGRWRAHRRRRWPTWPRSAPASGSASPTRRSSPAR